MALTSITPLPSAVCTGLQLSECNAIHVCMCVNVGVFLYALCVFVCVPSSEASLDVRLPTNPLLCLYESRYSFRDQETLPLKPFYTFYANSLARGTARSRVKTHLSIKRHGVTQSDSMTESRSFTPKLPSNCHIYTKYQKTLIKVTSMTDS